MLAQNKLINIDTKEIDITGNLHILKAYSIYITLDKETIRSWGEELRNLDAEEKADVCIKFEDKEYKYSFDEFLEMLRIIQDTTHTAGKDKEIESKPIQP